MLPKKRLQVNEFFQGSREAVFMVICEESGRIPSTLEAPGKELDPLTFLIATSLLEKDDERASFRSARSQSDSGSLILLAHGSNDPQWRAYFERILEEVRVQEPGVQVRLAFMEFTGPTLREAVAECQLDGATQIRILPLFLNTGVHLVRDVPAQIAEIEGENPSISITLLPAAGEDPRVSNLLIQIARESLRIAQTAKPPGRPQQ
jgi:sirohydrochlorin cobaltochelatase